MGTGRFKASRMPRRRPNASIAWAPSSESWHRELLNTVNSLSMEGSSLFEGDGAIVRHHSVRSRRQFVKNFVVGTAFSSIAGREWFATVVADCVPSVPTAGILRVKVSDFPALQADNGSVRLALNPFSSSNTNVQPFYPVLVNRETANPFFTLRTRCSH